MNVRARENINLSRQDAGAPRKREDLTENRGSFVGLHDQMTEQRRMTWSSRQTVVKAIRKGLNRSGDLRR